MREGTPVRFVLNRLFRPKSDRISCRWSSLVNQDWCYSPMHLLLFLRINRSLSDQKLILYVYIILQKTQLRLSDNRRREKYSCINRVP